MENTTENQNADQPKDSTKIYPGAGREQDRQMYRTFIKDYSLDKHILSWLEQNYMVAGVEELWKYMMHELNQCFIDFAIERNEEMINEDLISDSPEMFLQLPDAHLDKIVYE